MSTLEERLAEEQAERERTARDAEFQREVARGDLLKAHERDVVMEARVKEEQARMTAEREAQKAAAEEKRQAGRDTARAEREAIVEDMAVAPGGMVFDDRYWARESLGQVLAHMQKASGHLLSANLWRAAKQLEDERRRLEVWVEILDALGEKK